MKYILKKVLQNRTWIIGIFLILCLVGIRSMISLPIDAVPDITNVQVMINTKTGALDPEQIEKTVTYAIETECRVSRALKTFARFQSMASLK